MKIAVILPAAGVGKRFVGGEMADDPLAALLDGPPPTKVELDLLGKPVFLHAIERFVHRQPVGQVILAVHPDRVAEFEQRHGDRLSFHGVTIVAGGLRERWETVQRALSAVATDCTHVAIHDAARPLVSDALIERVFDAARQHAAVIPGLPVAATLKRVHDHQVAATVDRSDLVEVQTPQVFDVALIRRAYAQAEQAGPVTDDASLVEALGEAVHVVEGESTNLKITRPQDLTLARALMQLASPSADLSRPRRRFKDEDDD